MANLIDKILKLGVDGRYPSVDELKALLLEIVSVAEDTPALKVNEIPYDDDEGTNRFEAATLQEAATLLGITEEQTVSLYKGEYNAIKVNSGLLKNLGGDFSGDNDSKVVYGTTDCGYGTFAVSLLLWIDEDGYGGNFYAM